MSKVLKVVNKGTGAGGSQTTVNGSTFEKRTDMEELLISRGYEKVTVSKSVSTSDHAHYLQKVYDKKTIYYVKQHGFKPFIQEKYGFKGYFFQPDEAFITEYNDKVVVKILEKKSQQCGGSVDIKLFAGTWMRESYKRELNSIKKELRVEFAFCLDDFLKNKIKRKDITFKHFEEMAKKDNIEVFYGDEKNYKVILYNWIRK